ncbi:unnamed protein product [Citrullus colocynthis]|uniref:Uncharacterized protein n=1 Tax=Citrullus colocynthis TaxID=252529 RepID=A0ABP0YG54_9ROSI
MLDAWCGLGEAKGCVHGMKGCKRLPCVQGGVLGISEGFLRLQSVVSSETPSGKSGSSSHVRLWKRASPEQGNETLMS